MRLCDRLVLVVPTMMQDSLVCACTESPSLGSVEVDLARRARSSSRIRAALARYRTKGFVLNLAIDPTRVPIDPT